MHSNVQPSERLRETTKQLGERLRETSRQPSERLRETDEQPSERLREAGNQRCRPASPKSSLSFCHWLALSAVLALGGCASSSLMNIGEPIRFGKHFTATPTLNMESQVLGYAYQSWTIDGHQLNSLYVIADLKPGEHIFRDRNTRRDQTGMRYRPDLENHELAEMVMDGLKQAGSLDTEVLDLQPKNCGAAPGFRSKFRYSNSTGLAYRGLLQGCRTGDLATLFIFLAPDEHYFDRDQAAIGKMLDSLRSTK
jgi:hypothetical protein